MNLLNKLYVNALCRATKVKESFEEFRKSENGVSNVVATIIILLIVVLIIGVFWERLQGWLSGMMDQIFGTSFSADGM